MVCGYFLLSLWATLVWADLLWAKESQASASPKASKAPYHIRQKEFHPWSRADLQGAESLFRDFFQGTPPDQQLESWKSLGMSLTHYPLPNEQNIYLLSPLSNTRQGAGYYLLRVQHPRHASAPVILQAPHQFHDRHTGQIAVALFSEHDISALALNSAHRRRVDNRASLSANPDLSHNPNTLHMSFTRGFLAAQGEGKVVQLHGFSPAKRKTAAGRKAQVIVSGGVNWPTIFSAQVDACLATQHSGVLLYPQDVNELGGTTNSISNWLAISGKEHFLHLENSRTMRENLLNNLEVRSLFWSCISKTLYNIQAGSLGVEKFPGAATSSPPDSRS